MAAFSEQMKGLVTELERVRSIKGELTDVAIVEVASNPADPLHSRFEWDNQIAGHAHRLNQARGLIRSVKVQVVRPGGESFTVRRYQPVARRDAHRSDYQPTEDVLADPFERQILLRRMEREWRSLRSRFEHLSEFATMINKDLNQDAS